MPPALAALRADDRVISEHLCVPAVLVSLLCAHADSTSHDGHKSTTPLIWYVTTPFRDTETPLTNPLGDIPTSRTFSPSKNLWLTSLLLSHKPHTATRRKSAGRYSPAPPLCRTQTGQTPILPAAKNATRQTHRVRPNGRSFRFRLYRQAAFAPLVIRLRTGNKQRGIDHPATAYALSANSERIDYPQVRFRLLCSRRPNAPKPAAHFASLSLIHFRTDSGALSNICIATTSPTIAFQCFKQARQYSGQCSLALSQPAASVSVGGAGLDGHARPVNCTPRPAPSA